MYKLFNNILVPIDAKQQSPIAIEKTMQVARRFNCEVHVLEVTGGFLQRTKKERAIAEYAAIHSIDLILAQKRQHLLPFFPAGLDINRLAAKTNCPVLSLCDLTFSGIKNIVLPIAGYLPLRRVMLATYLARNFNAAIHLIALNNGDATAQNRNQAYLHRAFQLLRENTTLAVKCSTMEGRSIADTTLEYAKRIKADLILANPGEESLLSGRMFARFLFNQSNIPVLTVI
jgi:K+-sensing histidine kinase KdpD